MDLDKVNLMTEADSLRRGWQACEARLAAVEAKRDVARAEVAHMKREQQAMIMQHRHDIRDLGELLQDERCKVATLEAQRDQALAGEARAVEALDVFARAYQVSMLPFAPGIDEADGAHHWMPHGWPSVADLEHANAALTDSSALDWLAQQRREAAAEALEKLAADLGQDPLGSTLHDVDSLRGILRTRAAAIRAGEVGNE